MFRLKVRKNDSFEEICFIVKDFNALHGLMSELLSTEEPENYVFEISMIPEVVRDDR